MRLKLLLFILSLCLTVKPVLAGVSPTLVGPADKSTVSSSKLDWQTPSYSLYSSNPYRVQVDDDSTFASINKDYYTDNTYYTPALSLGNWYWRVKAKDISGTWSDWSNIWSFVLSDSASTSTPTPTLSPTPQPALATTPAPTSQPTSSFTTSNNPSQINSDESFTASINLSLPDNPNTNFFLKGAFKKADGSNYFGETKVAGNWIKNGSSYSDQFSITTNNSGIWSGNIEIKPDADDSGFVGTGDYTFKVGRYTSAGSGPTWSNEATIKITYVASSTTNNSPTPEPTIKNNNSSSPSPTYKAPTPKPTPSSASSYRIATVAGATAAATVSAQSATHSSQVSVKDQKQISPIVWVGLVFILIGGGFVGYIILKKNAKIPI